ncbi:putative mitochondrial protein, partial [Nicotiana attenuata]
HLAHLRSVFDSLRSNALVVKRSKCQFGQSSISYLGHILSSDGLQVDPEKIAAIICWPYPSSVKDVRGFLGLTGYYRSFVKGYAQLASPLTDLLKKDSFLWSDMASAAFLKLKKALSSVPVLSLPDFSKVFTVETDASSIGIGAVLSQEVLLEEFHSSKIGGHTGISRTFHRLSSNFYWDSMRTDVKIFIMTCQICQQMKDSNLKPVGLLSPLPIPEVIFEDISMDFITGLPPSHGRTVILVIVDPDTPTAWFSLLPWAEFWYNTSYHHSSKVTPFEVVYGRPPPTVSRYVKDNLTNPAVAASLRQRDEVLAILKANLIQAQERMKVYVDKGRREVVFEVGDWVYVRLRPYR